MRTPEEWSKVLGSLPSPSGERVEVYVASRILSDLLGYKSSSKFYREDLETLANALEGWGLLLSNTLGTPPLEATGEPEGEGSYSPSCPSP